MSEKTYKALRPIGRFMPGDIVSGLTAAQIAKAVDEGYIVADEPEPEKGPAKPAPVAKQDKATKEPSNG